MTTERHAWLRYGQTVDPLMDPPQMIEGSDLAPLLLRAAALSACTILISCTASHVSREPVHRLRSISAQLPVMTANFGTLESPPIIVLPEAPTPTERFAASELAEYIFRII